MEKTLPRGLCIRRKDKNRKQSRNNYIRIRIPRLLISSQSRTNSRVRHYQQARTPPPPTTNSAVPTSFCGQPDDLGAHSFANAFPATVPSVQSTDIPAPHLAILSREISRVAWDTVSDGSVGVLPTVGLRPNRWVEVINSHSRFFLRRGLTALVAIEYLSIAWEGSLNTLDESDGPDSQTLFHLQRAGANHVQSQQAIRLPALARITAERAVAAVPRLLDQSGLCSPRRRGAVLYSA